MTREEHLAWCKQRALEYLDIGDLKNAVISMYSDMRKHPDLGMSNILGYLGLMTALSGNTDEVRRWIEGFH